MQTARLGLLLVLLLMLLTPRSLQAAEPEVGALHPELRLPTIDGERTVSLRALRGRKILLIQFASW
jgi:hypothetical protein